MNVGGASTQRLIQKEVLALFKDGMAPKEIAKKLNITYDMVRYRLHAAGVRKQRTEFDPKVLIAEYNSGATLAALGVKYGVVPQAIGERIRNAGGTVRSLLKQKPKNYICMICGIAFQSRGSNPSKTCSQRCRKIRRNQTTQHWKLTQANKQHYKCPNCGKLQTKKIACSKVCSEAIERKMAEQKREARKRIDYCAVCGRKITHFTKYRVVCSAECRHKYSNKQSHDWYHKLKKSTVFHEMTLLRNRRAIGVTELSLSVLAQNGLEALMLAFPDQTPSDLLRHLLDYFFDCSRAAKNKAIWQQIRGKSVS